MLETLRKMPLVAKKKLVAVCASFLTIAIFGAWLLHAMGIFSSAYTSAHTQGVALFSFVEQNVQNAYDSFQANVPSLAATSTATSTEENASSTAKESTSIEASTTIMTTAN